MKKLVILLSLVLFQTFAQSDSTFNPTAKGRKLLSCDFNISNKTNSIIDTLSSQKSNTLNINVGAGFGYFIANNLAIGIRPRLSYNEFNIDSYSSPTSVQQSTNINSLDFGLSAFSRYYVDISKRIKFYVSANVGFRVGNSENKTIRNNIERNSPSSFVGVFANISPGLAFFVSKKVALEFTYGSLYFNTYNNARKNVNFVNEDKTINYGFDFNSSAFSFGLSYYF